MAQLIEDAANVHREQQAGREAVSRSVDALSSSQLTESHLQLSRQGTRTSFATTLVGSANSQYGKLELGEEGDGQEHHPLAGDMLGAAEMGQLGKGGEAKLSRWQKLKLHWKEYLVSLTSFSSDILLRVSELRFFRIRFVRSSFSLLSEFWLELLSVSHYPLSRARIERSLRLNPRYTRYKQSKLFNKERYKLRVKA